MPPSERFKEFLDKWEADYGKGAAWTRQEMASDLSREVQAVEDVWKARLAAAEGYISALVEGKAKAEALREDGIPVCYLRGYEQAARERAIQEVTDDIFELIGQGETTAGIAEYLDLRCRLNGGEGKVA